MGEEGEGEHRDTLVKTACRLCSCSSMRIIYCCPIQLGGEFSNYTGFLPPYSFPFSMPALGGCQILTLEAPLITEKAPCMYYGYLYSKDDVRSPFVKPPWRRGRDCRLETKRFYSLTQQNHIEIVIYEVSIQISMLSSLMLYWLSILILKGQSHEKVGEMRVQGDSLGPNCCSMW
jgi:hypothetical protein